MMKKNSSVKLLNTDKKTLVFHVKNPILERDCLFPTAYIVLSTHYAKWQQMFSYCIA